MKRLGLTVVEVMVAIVIIGVLLAVLTPSVIQSMRQTSKTGQRTQSVQIINYMARRLAANHDIVIPTSTSAPLEWDYEELEDDFGFDLKNDTTHSTKGLDNYKVTIELVGSVVWLGINLNQYNITVCFRNPDETCIVNTTLSSPRVNDDTASSVVGVF
jgi:prepilin-type N-terminal cleavage/methylation domain-containing protein